MKAKMLKCFMRMREDKLTNMRKAFDASLEIGEEYTPRDEDLEIIYILDNTIQKMTSHLGIQL